MHDVNAKTDQAEYVEHGFCKSEKRVMLMSVKC